MLMPPPRSELLAPDEQAKLTILLDSGRGLRNSLAEAQSELRHVDKDARNILMRNLGHYAMFKGKALRLEFAGGTSRALTRTTMFNVPAGYYQIDFSGTVQLPEEVIDIANLKPQEPGDIVRYGVPLNELHRATLAEIRAVEKQRQAAQ